MWIEAGRKLPESVRVILILLIASLLVSNGLSEPFRVTTWNMNDAEGPVDVWLGDRGGDRLASIAQTLRQLNPDVNLFGVTC